MKNRNDELEPEPGFDYEAYDEEQALQQPVIEVENPYEDYDLYDVEITETAIKKITVYAKDKKSAKEYIESILDCIDMQHDIDVYKKTVETAEWCGSSDGDYTVPLWWYPEEGEGDESARSD